MLTLAMITEMVFSWPGLGRWMINAIRQQDYAFLCGRDGDWLTGYYC
jgi:ABC-type antimicrobial peptide transport system permease subunit